MDLVIPDGGTELLGAGANGMIQLKELDGAEYIGTFAGLAINGQPIDVGLTWPDAEGAFTISIPSVDFSGSVSFFQAQLRFFTPAKQAPGGAIRADVVPSTLTPHMPRGLNPIQIERS
jgi:hypothetical protein